MRVVLLGLPCEESVAAVRAMQAAGVAIATIIVAGGARGTEYEALTGLTGAPVAGVANMAEGEAAVRAARPEVVVVACFPWRLPRAVLELPRLGCLNIHPSLLPRWRGPDPVFWAYRAGERETGVTVHRMDAGFDTGPILAQESAAIPIGSRAPDLERALMAAGGRLTAALLPRLERGEVTPWPQDEARATAAPMPTTADFELPATWTTERAYAFAAGVAPLAGPLAVQLASGERLPVRDVLDYAANDQMPGEAIDEGRGISRVRFGDGWVRFLRADTDRYPLVLEPSKARDIR